MVSSNVYVNMFSLFVILRTLRGLHFMFLYGVYDNDIVGKILTNFSLKRGRCNDHDAFASAHYSIPACCLYVSQHIESAHT